MARVVRRVLAPNVARERDSSPNHEVTLMSDTTRRTRSVQVYQSCPRETNRKIESPPAAVTHAEPSTYYFVVQCVGGSRRCTM